MTLDAETLKHFRAFHKAVTSMEATALWKNNDLRVGLFMSAGPGLHVHTKDLPDLERFRSLMLDFRQLLNNDLTNFNRSFNQILRNRVRDAWSDEEIERAKQARERFNAALDQPAECTRSFLVRSGPRFASCLMIGFLESGFIETMKRGNIACDMSSLRNMIYR